MRYCYFIILCLLFACQKDAKKSVKIHEKQDTLPAKVDTPKQIIKKYKKIERQDAYAFPLDSPLRVSGTFAELRGNHFHAGIDLRTQGVEGKPVYAADRAYVSRINVSPSGYGKAIYLQHPDGNTSVYGHLSRFSDKIERYLMIEQYRLKKNEITKYLKPNTIQIGRGEEIGKSGNTGGSAAPHLHFEVRKSNGKVINPLKYFTLRDTLSPVIKFIGIVPLDSQFAYYPKAITKQNIQNKIVYLPAGHYAIAAYWSDYFVDFNNKLGVNKMKLFVDNKIAFEAEIKDFQFNHRKYIYLHTNYGLKMRNGLSYTNLYKVKGNILPYYKGDGKIDLQAKQKVKVQVFLEDEAGNKTHLDFYLEAKPEVNIFKARKLHGLKFYLGKEESLKSEKYQFYCSPSEVLEQKNIGFRYDSIIDILKILPNDVPFKGQATLKLRAEKYGKEEYKYLLIGQKIGNTFRSIGGYCQNGWVQAKINSLGEFKILKDDIPPEVKYVKIIGSQLRIGILDKLSGIKDYQVKINNKWFRVYYERKYNMLLGDLNDLKLRSNLSIEVLVKDYKYNTTSIKKELKWQP